MFKLFVEECGDFQYSGPSDLKRLSTPSPITAQMIGASSATSIVSCLIQLCLKRARDQARSREKRLTSEPFSPGET